MKDEEQSRNALTTSSCKIQVLNPSRPLDQNFPLTFMAISYFPIEKSYYSTVQVHKKIWNFQLE